MKKMNLKFFGLRAKIVLPLFLLMGLFMLTANSVSAQYVSKGEAKSIMTNIAENLKSHPGFVTSSKLQANQNGKIVKSRSLRIKQAYIQMFLEQLGDSDVATSLSQTYEVLLAKIPANELLPIHNEFVELLTTE